MHSVFLYHAIKAGMDMGIVNAGQLDIYDDIPAELRERVEDVILNRRADATERLVEIAEGLKGQKGKTAVKDLSWREAPVEKRLEHALVHGITEFILPRKLNDTFERPPEIWHPGQVSRMTRAASMKSTA